MICYLAFTVKGQAKAQTASKGSFGVDLPILFKLYGQAYWPLLMIFYLQSKAKQRLQWPLKVVFARPYGKLSGASGQGPVGPGGASHL